MSQVAAPATTATPRPIVISSTSTPGRPPTPSGGPAVPNPTALTPFATSIPTQPTAEALLTVVASNQIRTSDFSFAPVTLEVTAGIKVTWTNAGPSNHTITANDGSWDSGIVVRNSSFSYTPTRAGTFAYHCAIHPTMQGTLVVR